MAEKPGTLYVIATHPSGSVIEFAGGGKLAVPGDVPIAVTAARAAAVRRLLAESHGVREATAKEIAKIKTEDGAAAGAGETSPSKTTSPGKGA